TILEGEGAAEGEDEGTILEGEGAAEEEDEDAEVDGADPGAVGPQEALSWLAAVEGIDGVVIETLLGLGLGRAEDLLEWGAEGLAELSGIDETLAAAIVEEAARHGQTET
ncbi:MAG: helix-hairpin-helix domain-containing protein, partial [Planctomycetes bacterium]|nr:helix-hairpin-helix domain-containing protein [Planctomycetota bacterium]